MKQRDKFYIFLDVDVLGLGIWMQDESLTIDDGTNWLKNKRRGRLTKIYRESAAKKQINSIKLWYFKITPFSTEGVIFLHSYIAKLFFRRKQMQIRNRIYNNTLYVVLSGELDEYSATEVRLTLDELFEKEGFNQVIVDLSELEFMDSTGVGVMLGRYKKLKGKNVPIFICNPSSHAEKIFKMTGLYEIMPKIS